MPLRSLARRLGLRPLAFRASAVRAQFLMRRLGRGNRVLSGRSLLGLRVHGHASRALLQVGDGCRIRRLDITIWGDGGQVVIGDGVQLSDTVIHLAGNVASVTIGAATTMESGGRLDATEAGARILIGRDCMISTNVQVRTSDAHGIFSVLDGRRLNPPTDVTVGNHVWIGEGAMLLKGSFVGSGSVVGARAVVTRSVDEPSAVLVGIPARVIRRGVTWTRDTDGAGEHRVTAEPARMEMPHAS